MSQFLSQKFRVMGVKANKYKIYYPKVHKTIISLCDFLAGF
jgi:hypothetical protein